MNSYEEGFQDALSLVRRYAEIDSFSFYNDATEDYLKYDLIPAIDSIAAHDPRFEYLRTNPPQEEPDAQSR